MIGERIEGKLQRRAADKNSFVGYTSLGNDFLQSAFDNMDAVKALLLTLRHGLGKDMVIYCKERLRAELAELRMSTGDNKKEVLRADKYEHLLQLPFEDSADQKRSNREIADLVGSASTVAAHLDRAERIMLSLKRPD